MRALARLAALFFAAAIGTGPLFAQSDGGEGAEAPQAPIAFRPVVEQVIDEVVVPGYRALAEAADREAASVAALCAAPAPAGLAAARTGFAALVDAMSEADTATVPDFTGVTVVSSVMRRGAVGVSVTSSASI